MRHIRFDFRYKRFEQAPCIALTIYGGLIYILTITIIATRERHGDKVQLRKTEVF